MDGIRRGYVLDASHLEKRDNVKALTLDWRGVTGFQLVDIAASDNLQDWRSVRRDAQLARLDYNGQRIERRRINSMVCRAATCDWCGAIRSWRWNWSRPRLRKPSHTGVVPNQVV